MLQLIKQEHCLRSIFVQSVNLQLPAPTQKTPKRHCAFCHELEHRKDPSHLSSQLHKVYVDRQCLRHTQDPMTLG